MSIKNNTFAIILGALPTLITAQVSFDGNPWIPQTGIDCSAFGDGALRWGGSAFNTALGTNAMYWAGAADECVAFGTEALMMISTTFPDQVSGCTALGNNALHWNARGDQNTASGYRAMYSNSDGSKNTATGSDALSANTFGSNNVATGFNAMLNNSDIGGQYGADNTAVGAEALYNNLSGIENTAIGARSLLNLQSGKQNTAAGFEALFSAANSTGSENTAAGYTALHSNSSGTQNTAIGEEALYNNTSGSLNTACGTAGLYSNTTGNQNVAFGQSAIHDATTVDANVGIGCNTLYKATGGYNVATGYAAFYNLTGSGSINNTAYSAAAGLLISSGSGLTMIGGWSDATGSYNNAAALGYGATVTNSSRIRLGNAAIGLLKGQPATWTPPVSDERFKYNISENDVKGSEFIMKLRPVTYNLDTRKLEEFLLTNAPDSVKQMRLKGNFSNSTNITRTGFIAQEVEAAAKEVNYNFNGIMPPENETDHYRICYAYFVVPMVKTVQEQSKIVNNTNALNSITNANLNEVMSSLNSSQVNAIIDAQNSIADILSGFSMIVQPNPFSSETNIKYHLPADIANATLIVTDLQGRKVSTANLSAKENSKQLQLDKLPVGMYIFSVVADGITLGSTKVLVQNK